MQYDWFDFYTNVFTLNEGNGYTYSEKTIFEIAWNVGSWISERKKNEETGGKKREFFNEKILSMER